MKSDEKEKLEKLAIQIQKECEKDGEPVTWAESLEMAEMELKSKRDCKHYEQSDKPRKKPNREKKIDDEKKEIIQFIADSLQDIDVQNIVISNVDREVTFQIKDNEYSLTLVKHRPPKKK